MRDELAPVDQPLRLTAQPRSSYRRREGRHQSQGETPCTSSPTAIRRPDWRGDSVLAGMISPAFVSVVSTG
jgi:hypothetical protein